MASKLYYMHPVNTYGTELERQQLELISSIFPTVEIVNPNQPEHQEGYNRLRQATGDGMPYFTELASQCQAGVALPFRDGKLGAGIFKEATRLVSEDRSVWLLTFDGRLTEFNLITDEHRRLSVEDTRKRIRNEDGSSRAY